METNWTERRVERLEKRVDERIQRLEKRDYERTEAIYSAITWTLTAAIWGLAIAEIAIAAARH